jgi:mycofactocin precursor
VSGPTRRPPKAFPIVPPEAFVPETPQTDSAVLEPTAVEGPLVEESLVEEVSIDGMCGVY